MIPTGSFPQSLVLSSLSQRQCPRADGYCNTASPPASAADSGSLTQALCLVLPRLSFILNEETCNIWDDRCVHVFHWNHLHPVHNPTSRSAVSLPSGEVSAVKGTKRSLSIHLHPLCLCLSPRQLASLEYRPIVNVSQPRLLSLG